ncbi:NUMOD1 domain-containing DNA-binding protein [Flavobacterium nackdongense]|nr:NUMOD1 domain-containing DNA-binding protein [Flavobacterium nackdongense]
MENKAGIIYKVINNETNEVYIGATTQTIENRKKDHIQKSNTGTNRKFYNAISTYGHDSFNWVQIDSATSLDELAQKEIKYILENDSLKNGYNSDKGGGIKKTVYQYNLDGTPVNSFEDLTSAAISINTTKKGISKACWNVNHTLGGYLWSYEQMERFIPESDNRKKVVIQYNLNGNLFAQFISVAEASRETGISKSSIAKCCRRERKQAGGFLWKYS